MRKIRMAVVVAASALLAVADVSATASATPAPSPVPSTATKTVITTITATRTVKGSSKDGVVTPAAGVTIVCTVYAGQYPHNSSHVNGTVNYVATASCTAPVKTLTVTATLHPPIPYAPIQGAAGIGTISVQSNAAKPCTNGSYYGTAVMYVAFPAGFTPSFGSASGTSPTVSIIC